MSRGNNPQWTTIMSHRVACYSKGAELASNSAADAHLFWHFLSTLTQKTHDNATLCISKVQAVWPSPFSSPFLIPMIPKTTFHIPVLFEHSSVDVKGDRQNSFGLQLKKNKDLGSYKEKSWWGTTKDQRIGNFKCWLSFSTGLQATSTSLKIPKSPVNTVWRRQSGLSLSSIYSVISFSPFLMKFMTDLQCIHLSSILIKEKAKYGCQESCTGKQMQSSC